MTAALVDAVGDRPLPLAVTAGAEHVVVRVNPAARKLVGDVVGRPVRDALPHPPLLATGGRVLNVVAVGKDFAEARRRAYEALAHVRLDGGQYRTDIAARVAE